MRKFYVTANMSSFPPRKDSLEQAVKSIIPQVDQLNIYLNQYDKIPEFLKHPKVNCVLGKDALGDLKAKGKFYFLDKIKTQYYFTIDDDIIYPRDYVKKLIEVLDKHNNQIVVGVHGSIYHRNFKSFLQSRTAFHFASKLEKGMYVNALGTGTVAFHKDFLKIKLDDFPTLSGVDIPFAIYCKNNKISRLCVSRKKGWLQDNYKGNGSIWENSLKDDSLQTKQIKGNKLWEVDNKHADRYIQYLEDNFVSLRNDLRNYHKEKIINENLNKKLEELQQRIQKLKNSKSFRLGDLFFRSIKSPWKILTFPVNAVKTLLEKNKSALVISPIIYEKDPNLDGLYEKEIKSNKKENRKEKVVVVSWSMSHNPVGRAYLLYDCLSRKYDVKLVGPLFKFWGKELWSPLKGIRNFSYRVLNGFSFPLFYRNIKKEIEDIEADHIIVCKPRIPSLLIGVLLHKRTDANVVLDIDDDELSFEKNSTSIKSISELERDFLNKEGELRNSCSETWTRFADSLISSFKNKIASNKTLQVKYGGEIIGHARDEKKFNPKIYDKDKIRKRLGFKQSDKIILFVGTPHRHKGVLEIAKALKKIGNENYKLCIVGTIMQKDVERELKSVPKKYYKIFHNQGFDKLPAFLSIADLMCLLQDKNSEITKFQIPAKISDAFSMEIPVLTTEVEPLKEIIEGDYVNTINKLNKLPAKIDEIFKNYKFYKEKARRSRDYFNQNLSYSHVCSKLERVLEEKESWSQGGLDKIDNFINFIDNKFGEKDNKDDKDKKDVVFFWKQNDSGIYGRRSDMITKYLSRNERIGRILHFDAPISRQKIKELQKDNNDVSQNKFILENIKNRTLKLSDKKNLFKRVFVYDNDYELNEYLKFIEEQLTEVGITPSQAIFWFCPINTNFREIIDYFIPGKVVSDIIDHAGSWKTGDVSETIDREYKIVMSKSDIVFCNNDNMKEYCRNIGENCAIHKLENGVEPFSNKEIHNMEKPEYLGSLRGRTLGYVGNLDSKRLDFELIKKIALQFKNDNVVLIGSAHLAKEDVLKLKDIKNIHFLGVKKYRDALKYIKYFDVCLIPHKKNYMTEHMNPLKFYLYLIFGKKIVTTDVAGLGNSNNHNIYISKDYNQFINNINKAFVDFNKSKEVVWTNKWDNIVDKMLNFLENGK